VLFQLRFDLSYHLRRRVVAELHVRRLLAELLPWIKLDDFPARLCGLLDRFENGVFIERIRLAPNGKASRLVLLGMGETARATTASAKQESIGRNFILLLGARNRPQVKARRASL
jgi:hypothetical protein